MMKKQMLFAAVAGLTLVSAHPGPVPAALQREARSGYPPCSRTVTDRCIQLYERGVRTPTNLALNAASAAAPTAVATAEPPARRMRPTVRVGGDDIDVSYAGDVLQAPRSSHHPNDVLRHVHGREGPTRVIVERHPGPVPRVVVDPRPGDAPTQVVVVRETRHAHAAPVALAEAHPPRMPRAHATPRAHAAPAAAHRAPAPRRPMSMRVRRAGERG
jgi:hypothetical protein